jgi:hydroxyacylglutathione hydrolase
MYFKQFLHDDTGCASYVIASRSAREAVVVDPRLHIQPYLDLAAERGYRIARVIDTHLHADHISGNRALAAATGAELALGQHADVLFPFRGLHDGERVRLGQLVLEIIHTPGHRPEAVSIAVTNLARSPEPSLVLSGDTLFVGDVGRPDFGGIEGAAEQYASVRRLLQLADYLEVFPSHFEGACGKQMCGRPSSTIGFERRFNPVLQLGEREFMQFAAEAGPRPLNMSAILATNRGAADFGWIESTRADSAPVASVTADQAATWLEEQTEAVVLDVREPAEYTAGHVPGARLLPQADLAIGLASVPRDQPLLVVCHAGTRSARASRFLAAVGYSQVTNLEGGTQAWIAAGLPIEQGGWSEDATD